MDDAVDDRRRYLVVSEHRPPAGELYVHGDYDRLSFAGIREYLEHEARPVAVGRQDPGLSMTSRATRPIYIISWVSLPRLVCV